MRLTFLLTSLAATLLAAGAAAQDLGPRARVQPDTLVSSTSYTRALIAADPDVPGRLAVGLSEANCAGGRQIVYVSNDDGASWQGTCLPMPDDFSPVPEDSPAVAVNLQGDLLAPAAYDEGDFDDLVGLHRSTDNGATWSEMDIIGGTPYWHGHIRNLHSTVDRAAKSLYRGSVYVTYTAFGPEDDATHIRLLRSTDGGQTWASYYASPEYDTSVFLDDASLAVARDGTLYLGYTKCKGFLYCADPQPEVLLTVSRDGGRTWEAKGSVDTPKQPMHRPRLVIDASKGPYAGSLYLVTEASVGGHSVIKVSRSTDQGATWSALMRVASGKAAQRAPWASVDSHGQLAITWMDGRNDPEGKKLQPMLALSSDGGASFSKPVVLDPDLWDPSQTGASRGWVSHAWSGGVLRAAFHGQDADGSDSVRAGGLGR